MQRISALIFGLALASPALGQVSDHTVTANFDITGKTAAAIYQSLLARSQHQGIYATLATTEVALQPAIVLRAGPPCRASHADLTLTFKVNLPRLTAQSQLSATTRRDWLNFLAHLRTHEAHHRTLWLICARRYQTTLRLLQAPDCGSFVHKAKAQWADIEKVCRAGNSNYDAEEEQRLLRFRFIQRALTGR